MKGELQLSNILYCYNNIKKNREDMWGFNLGKHLGFLEAGLMNFGYLETYKVGDTSEIKREMKPATKWWKKPKLETYEEVIIRMTEKMFKENQIEF